MTREKILITGATGFVGRRLCHRLHQHGYHVVAAVRRRSVEPDPVYEQLLIPDLTELRDAGLVLKDCHTIIHLAARVHIMDEKSANPFAAFRSVNVDATVSLARQASLQGVRRFVFISSAKVNGESTASKPFSAFDVVAPQDPYALSKWEAEQELRKLAQETNLEVVIVRPPLVYGPGVRANFLRLMRLVRLGLPLPLGNIQNRRSMVALDNLIDLLEVCAFHPAAAGQTFMVSDEDDLSISDLLHRLASCMGKRILLLPAPERIMTIAANLTGNSALADRLLGSLQVDIEHTKLTLGWKPAVSRQEALQETVAHFLAQH